MPARALRRQRLRGRRADATRRATAAAAPARIAAARTRSLEGRIPRRYRGVSFDRPPVSDIARIAPDQIRIGPPLRARRSSENLDAGRGLWLEGDVGTGKTTLAMLVSKAALDAGRSVAIYSLPRLLEPAARVDRVTEAGMVDFLDRLAAVDLLHIDDLGAENQTDWVLEQLYSIVNARYEAERAIIATTNLMPDELVEQLGARTVSRLVEICGEPLPLFGEDDGACARGTARELDATSHAGRRRRRPHGAAPSGSPKLRSRMPGIVIVGAQWGDEGKGKITDLLAEHGRRGRALPGRQQRRPHDRARRARSGSCT